MYNRYLIQTNTKVEEFFNKNKDLEIQPFNIGSFKYSIRDKFKNYMLIGCDRNGAINSLGINSIFNPYYVLYLLVTEESATLQPIDVFYNEIIEVPFWDPIDTESLKYPLSKEFTISFKKYIDVTMDFLSEDIFFLECYSNRN
jgi:hypothetical protein